MRVQRPVSPKVLEGSEITEDSLANAAAAMWIYLRENDLIDFENCDPRHHE